MRVSPRVLARRALLRLARAPSQTHALVSRLLLARGQARSEEHTSELQSQSNLVCRLLLEKKNKLITNVRSSLMAVTIHITIIELNALHPKRQNLFEELDSVIHLLMEAKNCGLRTSRESTS